MLRALPVTLKMGANSPICATPRTLRAYSLQNHYIFGFRFITTAATPMHRVVNHDLGVVSGGVLIRAITRFRYTQNTDLVSFPMPHEMAKSIVAVE